MRIAFCRRCRSFGAAGFLVLMLPALSCLGAPQDAESAFFTQVLGFLGISATPGSLKGDEDERPGELWVADLAAGARYAITDEGGYRSPVFLHGDEKVLALRGEDVVEVPVFGGDAETRATIPGVVKLVGAHRTDPNRVLLLLQAEGGVRVAVLDVDTGGVVALDPESDDPDGERLLPHLRRSERVYGDMRLFVREDRGEVNGRSTVWTGVYVQDGEGAEARDVSRCKPASCGEPSLSLDHKRVVYVKSPS